MSATFADFYKREHIRQAGSGLTPRLQVAAIYPPVNHLRLIQITKLDTPYPSPMNEIYKFKNGWLFQRWEKLQYYIQIDHIKVKIEANEKIIYKIIQLSLRPNSALFCDCIHSYKYI